MARTDRIIIAIALLALLSALGMLSGIDSYFQTQVRGEADAVAEIISRAGDVRVKYKDQLQWQPGREHQKLLFNDAVFVGPQSAVDIKVGESKLSLDSNTMVILRKEQIIKSFNLNYGTLNGFIAKNDKLMIETANGEKFELKASEASKVKIESKAGKTSVKVVEGSAKVMKDGKVQTLSTRDAIEFHETKPKRSDPLVFVAPLESLFYTSNSSESPRFQWAYSSGRPISSEDYFVLEFSEESTFKSLALKDDVLGEAMKTTRIAAPAELYFRVRDERGNFSETRKIMLRHPSASWILSPADQSELEVERGAALPTRFSFSKSQSGAKFWFQIARDEEFKDLVLNRTFLDNHFTHELSHGRYFARVKSVYNQSGVQSGWSRPVAFGVLNKIDMRRLAKRLPGYIRIPNRDYPGALYSARVEDVQKFLMNATTFKTFFADQWVDGYALIVNRRRTDEPPARLEGAQFPASWIYPGDQRMEFYLEANGKTRTSIRELALRIEMEAPNRLRANARGELGWSPILFAKGFEGELRDGAGKVTSFKSVEPSYRAKLARGANYAYRVRALGPRGKPISDWSESFEFRGPVLLPKPVEHPIAAAAVEEETRKPAAEEKASSAVKIEEKYIPWKKIGYWFWGGTGFNYFLVRQTVNSTADVEYKNTHGPSLFVESGYLSNRRWGGAVAFKRTPGEVRVDNYPINKREFAWNTYSLEALYTLPWASQIWRHHINWGLRGGVQYHSFPFLYVDSGNQLIQVQNNLLAGSLGFWAETDGRFRYHWHMRYQHPLQSSTEGGNSFEVKPLIAFDGSVGASYMLTDSWKTGLFWYGQLHQYDFTYRSSTRSNSGSQSLFYSNMELRFGLDF